ALRSGAGGDAGGHTVGHTGGHTEGHAEGHAEDDAPHHMRATLHDPASHDAAYVAPTALMLERAVQEAVANPPGDVPSLTVRARALYEDGVVPVREIAQLVGVSERTLYKYAQRGGWRHRHARGEAKAKAKTETETGTRPALARGAGGRFIRRAEAGKPHASGLKALDPAGAAAAAARCADAQALARNIGA